jgi:hypothetical protein
MSRVAAAILAVGLITGAAPIRADETRDGNTRAEAQPYCQLFSMVRERLSVGFGRNVDPLTRFAGVDVLCHEKTMVFRQDVNLESRMLGEAWIARRQSHWSKTYCHQHAAFSEAIRAGWTISTILTLADGHVVRFDAACHDADA